ncbi:MAG: hypothetical protein J6V83_02845 [Clostridia bacterium]|nr:hypothetical protein [Clostridia bacterium]
MSFFNEVATLFTGMSWVVALALLLGFVFIVIEIFNTGFGVFGFVGAGLVIIGTVLRVLVGDGNLYAQIFLIIFMESIGALIAFFILVTTAKKGWVARSPLIESVMKAHAEECNEEVVVEDNQD